MSRGDLEIVKSVVSVLDAEIIKEEQAASQGARFDARPVYMIKMPGQNAGSRIDAPFSAIHTRSLLDAVFSDRLHNADGLQSWAARQH